MWHRIDDVLKAPAGECLPECTSAESAALKSIADWSMSYLCTPEPALGRSGVVCPWSPPSIKQGHFYLECQRSEGLAPEQIAARMLERLETLRAMEPRTGRNASLKTVVVLFPELSEQEAGAVIDDLHGRLKPLFVKQGYMLGEFYANSSKCGIRSQSFRPLRSPVPLLVIRDLVRNDVVFLMDRREFADAYLAKHGLSGCVEIFRMINDPKSPPAEPEHVALLFDAVHRFDATFTSARKRIGLVTGLADADSLSASVGAAFARGGLADLDASAVLVRVNNLEEIASKHSRAAADFVLWKLGKLLRAEARESDFLVWHKEDTFGLLLTSGEGSASALAARLQRRVFTEVFKYGDQNLQLLVTLAADEALGSDKEPANFFKRVERAGSWRPLRVEALEDMPDSVEAVAASTMRPARRADAATLAVPRLGCPRLGQVGNDG